MLQLIRETCSHVLHKVVQQTANELLPGSKIQCIQWTRGAFPWHLPPCPKPAGGTNSHISDR